MSWLEPPRTDRGLTSDIAGRVLFLVGDGDNLVTAEQRDQLADPMSTDNPIERATQLYEQAVFGGDADALTLAERELDTAEADLALARGRILHARFLQLREEIPQELALFEQAAELYRRLGDTRGEAEALFWIGCYRQVVREDHAAARPTLERSYELAAGTGDELTMSYAVRHLGFADQADGDTAAARRRFEESVLLRRNLGFEPGIAAGLLALAHLSVQEGDRDQASALLEEAESIARSSRSHGVLTWIEQVRRDL